jgi:crotonobetainyl-CoA:carnitine CoA-transferase CaiB-like acyl-CoA transferase
VNDGERRAVLPLRGVRVLAVSQYGAGPWATLHLADLGAEVIKIEDPRTGGDVARSVPPYAEDGDSLYFQCLNRNKRSLTLDLKQAEGQTLFRRLVPRAHIVFNNLRGDLPAKLGLDYRSLRDVNPAIVCCSLSGFGRWGARAAEPGYDYILQGYAGWMSLTGEPDGPPAKSGLSMVDLSAGVLAAFGMVAALLRARETGRGSDVEVSLFDAAISMLNYVGTWHLTRGYEPRRQPDSSHPSQVPSQVLPTRDGYLVVMCAKEKFWQNLCEVAGHPEWAGDPRFRTFADRLEHRDLLVPLLKETFRQRTTTEWLAALRGQVPCGPVNSVAEALRDPQTAEDGMILEVEHPSFGVVRQIATAVQVEEPAEQQGEGETPWSHRRAPKISEDTNQILTEELGLSPEEIRALRAEGVI